MKASLRLLAAATVLSISLGGATAAFAAAATPYEPSPGEEVVVYTHRFKPSQFEAGLKLVEEGFTAAQKEAGQTRKNDILVDRAHHTVVLVSYFGPGSDVDSWHKSMQRQGVLEKLKTMRSAPLQIERFKLEAVTHAP